MLRVLRSRDYFLFWSGSFIANLAVWIQQIALGWLVYDLTRRASLLGTVSFCGNVPILVLGLVGGAIADRASRRMIMLGTLGLGPADAKKFARAIGLTAEIFFAAGAREVYSGVHSRPLLHSIDEARALQRAELPAADFEILAFHPQGTAHMGEDPRAAVTDSYGRVHGTPGLWVGDASLFPSSCKVNPQITIMALATRLAERLAGEM